MNRHQVVIVGGGPTGLVLAAELALAGIDVGIVERRTSQDLTGQRAGGLHARTLEALDQRGIVDRFLAAGTVAQVAGFAWIPLDISDFPTRHPYGLALWQNEIERILSEWVRELGVPIHRGREVIGFTQDETGVDVVLADGTVLRAAYLVGCDGGRSAVRKAAGIDFPGWDATVSHLIAEVEVAEEPDWGAKRDALGIRGLSRMEDGARVRVLVTERAVGRSDEPTLADLSAELTTAYGTDFGVHTPTSISRFTDAARQAAAYRAGRVLLAGDAAHIHYPTGGQGLNTGVQDAVNLGWKLAQVVKGTSPESLLDSYHAERHPVAAAVLRNTMAQVALLRADDRTDALRTLTAEWLALMEPRTRIAAEITGMSIRYDFGPGHPLLGRRMPDLDLVTEDGPIRVYTLLHEARPVLLDLSAEGSIDAGDAGARGSRVRVVRGASAGAWELPLIGAVPAPTAVLIRPDGHAAWVGEGGSSVGLADAMERWFTPRATAS